MSRAASALSGVRLSQSLEQVTRPHKTGEESEEHACEDPDPDRHAQAGVPIGLLVMDCKRDHADENPDSDRYRHRDRFDDGCPHLLFGSRPPVWARFIERLGSRKLDITRHVLMMLA